MSFSVTCQYTYRGAYSFSFSRGKFSAYQTLSEEVIVTQGYAYLPIQNSEGILIYNVDLSRVIPLLSYSFVKRLPYRDCMVAIKEADGSISAGRSLQAVPFDFDSPAYVILLSNQTPVIVA